MMSCRKCVEAFKRNTRIILTLMIDMASFVMIVVESPFLVVEDEAPLLEVVLFKEAPLVDRPIEDDTPSVIVVEEISVALVVEEISTVAVVNGNSFAVVDDKVPLVVLLDGDSTLTAISLHNRDIGLTILIVLLSSLIVTEIELPRTSIWKVNSIGIVIF